ncbi:heavy-metal-associated domain-containing protein [Flavobacterium agrisoli]|uniref:Heavy-metal-associated domain-containing protein n=1 Tax=Flavobacterium agrisoli TaxID=2793066 RepID=A0A934PPI7_9FLAO|nr:heavy-metal-associated domain-containing protein [Flavobacterium agrisoli]MBK0370228.1 heavy-metal-associated domain-containing protein [Flavobacterium agrisoli]
MKLYISLLFTLFSIAFSFSQNKPGKAVIHTTIYCDHCKACETCGQNFKSKMLKINGVQMYELDEKSMTITVYYNPKKTNLELIKTGITQLGYDADDFKANPLAYENLDSCCKKK